LGGAVAHGHLVGAACCVAVAWADDQHVGDERRLATVSIGWRVGRPQLGRWNRW